MAQRVASNNIYKQVFFRLGFFIISYFLKVSKDTLAKYVRIERFIKHENYHSPKLYYDIALLELAESLQFNSRIRPICLWGSEETDPEEKLSISGWGVVDPCKIFSTVLMKIILK